MSQLVVEKSGPLQGELTVPGDKSITHRAILLGGLASGKAVIRGYLPSDDCLRTLRAMEEMGIRSSAEGNTLTVFGNGLDGLKEPGRVLDLGNSGTSLRLLTGVLSGQPFFSVMDGDESLRRRPMGRVIEPLSRMGADIRGRGGNRYAPIAVAGTRSLRGIDYRLPVASAQVKSAVLLAGLFASGTTRVEEPGGSRDHTERMLKAFGAEIDYSPGKASIVRSELKGIEIEVPGDISSAAFFIVAATIVRGSHLNLRNVGLNPTRTGLLDALGKMGAKLRIENRRDWGGEPVGDLVVESADRLKAIDVGAGEIPRMIDELPIFFIAAAFAEGSSRITGASELRVKESDRISVMAREMKKLGIGVEELPDGMVITGSEKRTAARFQSEGDHRVAMSAAVAALAADGESVIEDVDCIQTSFPEFEAFLRRASGSRREA